MRFLNTVWKFVFLTEILQINARLQMREDLWNTVKPQGRDSSVGLASGYGLDVRGSISSGEKMLPMRMAPRSKACSNTGIVGSNPTQGMDAYIYFLFVLGSRHAMGWSPVQGVLPTVLD
jgi:hypothetical protein